MKVEQQKYSERFLSSAFPNLSSLFLNFLLVIVFYKILKTHPKDSFFWLLTLTYLLLPVYLLLIKPYIESKNYITKIEFDLNEQKVLIEYLEFMRKKQITIKIQNLRYNTFNGVKIGLSDKIVFYDNKKEILTQYSNSDWDTPKINELTDILEKQLIKKPFGYNK